MRSLIGLMAAALLAAMLATGAAVAQQDTAQQSAAQEGTASEKVVAGLSQARVSIDANFDGSEILIFGAVKREAPPPDTGPLQVIIALSGPSSPVVVRKKDRVMGVWANRDAVTVDAAPSFYAIATTAPLAEILSDVDDLRHHISLKRMVRTVGEAGRVANVDEFAEALVRIRTQKGLYRVMDGGVELTEETLFRSRIALPANLVEGDYVARIYLIRDRQIVDQFETAIPVRKVGLERWIYSLAHEQPLIYGVLSLAIAIAAGWMAAAVFRVLKLS